MPTNPPSLSPAPAPAEGGLLVGHWPHLRGKDSTARIMWSVVACLLPAAIASGYFFGCRAYMHMALAVATAVLTEAVITRLRLGKVTVGDGSAVVTGLLVAFCLPAQARWYVPVVAAFIAIAIAKQCFGGLGWNIWNPALIGRAFVHVSFPTDMNPSKYPVLESHHFFGNIGTVGTLPEGLQAVTSASPMAALKHLALCEITPDNVCEALRDDLPSLWNMLLGNRGGDIGETCILLLVLGAVYLIAKGWIRWQIPAAYLGTVALGALVLPLQFSGEGMFAQVQWRPILLAAPDMAPRFVAYHLMGGGLVLGALYMATDMVTTPLTNLGMLIFGLGCGVLTILIRLYGGYPEAVCFSILLMNIVVPHIDRLTQPRIFGHKK